MKYYVIDNRSGKAVAGPFDSAWTAAAIVHNTLDDDPNFGTASRHMLAKWKYYPRTKAGDTQLEHDLSEME